MKIFTALKRKLTKVKDAVIEPTPVESRSDRVFRLLKEQFGSYSVRDYIGVTEYKFEPEVEGIEYVQLDIRANGSITVTIQVPGGRFGTVIVSDLTTDIHMKFKNEEFGTEQIVWTLDLLAYLGFKVPTPEDYFDQRIEEKLQEVKNLVEERARIMTKQTSDDNI